MWLTIRPPDDPFDKVYYYYDYTIREATEKERPSYYDRDASLRNQKCFVIMFKTKIEIDANNRFKIKFDDYNIFSEWNKSHSKEISNVGAKVRHQVIESIFNKRG